MKKLICLMVLLLMVSTLTLTLSGCKGGVEKPSAKEAPSSETNSE